MNTGNPAVDLIQLPSEVIRKWQEIVDLLAEIMHVPSALVMKVEPPNITVFVSSESKGNPYEQHEVASLNTGLYCETVMKTRQPLLVPDALLDEEWNSNPDIKLGMISYLGFPIAWPNGHIFGTICVLDNKRNEYCESYRKLLLQFREVLQADLRWLTELGGELATLKDHLSRANQLATIGELTASIAHEVNQPVAAVVANAEAGLQWLDREKPNLDGVRKALERIARDGADAGEIVTRLRRLFRRAAPLTAEQMLEELVTEVLKLLDHETIRRHISIDVAVGKELPPVLCDRLQIQQVILNLIVNAMDALDAVQHREKAIRVFARQDGVESILFGIRDYGAGVKDPKRLFETFFTTKENGLGLGLAISRSIIEAHAGQLWLEPTDGPGSTFCFRLPVKQSTVPQ